MNPEEICGMALQLRADNASDHHLYFGGQQIIHIGQANPWTFPFAAMSTIYDKINQGF